MCSAFKAFAFGTVLASGQASTEYVQTNRRLQQNTSIARYQPATSVTDQASIDLDQALIEELIEQKTEQSLANAFEIYKRGAHSRPYAEISISPDDLLSPILKGTIITGTAVDGRNVTGEALEDTIAGTLTVKILYDETSDTQEGYVGCQVGARANPVTGGCFVATGNVQIEGATSMSYSYNVQTDNKNNRTIQGFSTDDSKFRKNGDIEADYYVDFRKFADWYGTPNYADEFITAAAEGTSAVLQNAEFDFSQYGLDGRGEAFKKGTAFLAITMYVIRELEEALEECERCTENCTDPGVHSVDEAFAFFTGSRQGSDDAGDGVLLYQLGEEYCRKFKTCGITGDKLEGNAKVNLDVFEEFQRMQDNLATKECKQAHVNKLRIVQLIFVPIIQGTLHFAYITETQTNSDEKAEASGAAFAAAVLPMIAHCESLEADDADEIYNDMQPGQHHTADYTRVMKAFERNFHCMGISCEDIGGLYNEANNDFYPGTEPCIRVIEVSGSGSNPGTSNVGLAVGLTITLVVAVVAIAFFMKRRKRTPSLDPEFKSDASANIA